MGVSYKSLITLDEALDILSENTTRRDYRHIQDLAQEGYITPVFYRHGYVMQYYPTNIRDSVELLNKYDDNIPYSVFHQYFRIWERSQQQILEHHGWFTVDFAQYDHAPFLFEKVVNFNDYVSKPNQVIYTNKIIELQRIDEVSGSYDLSQALLFVVDNKDFGKDKLITPKDYDYKMPIRLNDWRVPRIQIEREAETYKKGYKSKIRKAHKKFMEEVAGTSADQFRNMYSDEQINNQEDISVKDSAETLCISYADAICHEYDTSDILRTTVLTELIQELIKKNHLNVEVPSTRKIKKYIKNSIPSYLSVGGAPTVEKQKLINELKQQTLQNCKIEEDV